MVADGSARAAFVGEPEDWPIAGKTGTGEVLGKRDTGSCPTPRRTAPGGSSPVVVTQAGTGGGTAAPVARAVHETLRGLR